MGAHMRSQSYQHSMTSEAVIRSETAYLAGELAKTGYLYDTDEEDDGEGPLAGEEEFGD